MVSRETNASFNCAGDLSLSDCKIAVFFFLLTKKVVSLIVLTCISEDFSSDSAELSK